MTGPRSLVRARGVAVLTPARARQCLRNTGSPQQDAPGRPRTQRIGTRPNIRELIACGLGKAPKEVKEIGKEFQKEVLKERPKELKDLKERPKEIKEKEFKEKEKERKEILKEKEIKEKELKEGKELKESVKEIKEGKDVKEKDKEFKEKDKDIREGLGGFGGLAGGPGDLAERVAHLEARVAQLVHFIAPELRPDLLTGALANEPDLQAYEQALLRQGFDAKAVKDNKDAEKLPDR